MPKEDVASRWSPGVGISREGREEGEMEDCGIGISKEGREEGEMEDCSIRISREGREEEEIKGMQEITSPERVGLEGV